MPLLVTDADVLAQIALNEAEATSIDAQLAILPTAPAATKAAWSADRASWSAWRDAATQRLSGGFLLGAWTGVAADGDAAIAWKTKLDGYQTIVSAVAAGTAPPYTVPPNVSVSAVGDANNGQIVAGATGAIGSVSDSVQGPLKYVAIVALAGLVALLVVKK